MKKTADSKITGTDSLVHMMKTQTRARTNRNKVKVVLAKLSPPISNMPKRTEFTVAFLIE